jgi:hypothetical protein
MISARGYCQVPPGLEEEDFLIRLQVQVCTRYFCCTHDTIVSCRVLMLNNEGPTHCTRSTASNSLLRQVTGGVTYHR